MLDGQVKQIVPLFEEHVVQVVEQTMQELLELFDGLTSFPEQLTQIPLFKKVFAGQKMHIDPLSEEQVAQFEEHTMHEELEFPYGFT